MVNKIPINAPNLVTQNHKWMENRNSHNNNNIIGTYIYGNVQLKWKSSSRKKKTITKYYNNNIKFTYICFFCSSMTHNKWDFTYTYFIILICCRFIQRSQLASKAVNRDFLLVIRNSFDDRIIFVSSKFIAYLGIVY